MCDRKTKYKERFRKECNNGLLTNTTNSPYYYIAIDTVIIYINLMFHSPFSILLLLNPSTIGVSAGLQARCFIGIKIEVK